LGRNLPPPAVSGPASPQYGFFGDYASFYEAAADSSGYNSASIALAIAKSLSGFLSGFTVPELIDSRIQQMHSIFVTLDEGRRIRVLDIGGGAGTYYFYLSRLSPNFELDWTILEQESVASACRSIDRQPFRYIDDLAQADDLYDIILASGSLQYISDPYEAMERYSARARHLIFNRMPIHDHDRDVIKIQKVPPHVYEGSMPVWFFSERRLLTALRSLGTIVRTWDVAADEGTWAQGGARSMRGYLIRPIRGAR